MTGEKRYVEHQRVEATPRSRVTEIPYTRPGTLAATESPEMVPATNTLIVGFSAALTTPGTGTSTIVLRRNGDIIATIDLASGETYGFVSVASVNLVGRTDRYNIGITAVGSGAAGLSGGIETAA